MGKKFQKMHRKEIIFFMIIAFLVSSCADTLSSVKRGLTGTKGESTDEFFVEKKDPLTLPPDFENLPLPSERREAQDRTSNIKERLQIESFEEETYSTSSTNEESILRQIRKK